MSKINYTISEDLDCMYLKENDGSTCKTVYDRSDIHKWCENCIDDHVGGLID